MMTHFAYVYGTLRPGNTEPVVVKGTLYDLGWSPGIKLGGDNEVICEKIEVVDFTPLDHYEGYFPDDEAQSLYIRRPIFDGYIYELNREANPVKIIQSGDWLDYTQEKRGINGGRF